MQTGLRSKIMKNLLNNHYIKTLAIILLVFAIFIAMFLPVAGTTYASAETSSNLQIGNMDKSHR